jgi:trk system potassium uptake protein TrkH
VTQRSNQRVNVIRRRAREPRVISLPILGPRPVIRSTAGNAKRFVFALLAVVAIGTALLSTPWTTESGESTPVVDALFTAVSATAVTGLITVDTQTHWNFAGELVILALIQTGGLGFMVGASLVLQALRRGQTRLSDLLLVQDGAPTLSLQEAHHLTGRIVKFTIMVESAGAILLTMRFARDMPLHDAIWYGTFHSISAFCNAGFDLLGGFQSLSPYQTSIWINAVIMALIQAGALSYMVFGDVIARRKWSALTLDTKLVLIVNAALLVVGTGVFLIAEWSRSLAPVPESSRPLAALFQSVAARTAGYSTVNLGDLHAVTMFVWVGIMLVGGASGSTAGGVKLATFGIVIAAVISTLRGREETTVFRRRVSTVLVFRAMAVITLMLLTHFLITIALGVTEDLIGHNDPSFIALMFEAMSAIATVGLSTGITPSMTTAGKLVLCFAMLFGRLGPLTAAYSLQRRQHPVQYRLPVAPVRIG